MVLFRRSRPGRPDRAAVVAIAEETAPTGDPTPAGSVAPAVPAARDGDDEQGPAPASLDPAAVPRLFGPVPNTAASPLPTLDPDGRPVPGTGIRKFVDPLPLPGQPATAGLGARLPVAVPDTITWPGCDYYEIGLQEYAQRLHRDLPATRLRGYRQLNLGTDASGHNTVGPPDRPWHLGPMIVARRGRPVRIKFINQLPTGRAGELFLPVDETVDGAGAGPLDGPAPYPQNRAVPHLSGAQTGWISAGNPWQWVTPAGEITPYPTGVGVTPVPDMPPPGAGATTLYFPNDQSGRLMWLHDNTLGLSRLTVYSGQIALYLLTDPAEERLVDDGVLPADQLPLVIEDKTFVPDDAQLAAQDPTWDRDRWGAKGSLWHPHVYQPRQNPYRLTGTNPTGRWDYGPWTHDPDGGASPWVAPVPNPHHDPDTDPDEPPLVPGVPHPSAVPDAYGDTPLVNGVAYPYLEVAPRAYRFRILNACADRALNLQLYRAASDAPMWAEDGSPADPDAGEVPMVEAVRAPGRPAYWPADGRDGGVPDPAAAGPEMIQIGNEGGLLPAPVVLTNRPVDYRYDRQDPTVLNVDGHALLLAPGERADVVVDFSTVPPGSTLILYNDCPAPLPRFDTRYDHHTGAPDRTAAGGLPPTRPGYGPNTRTLLQIRVTGTPAQPYDTRRLAERLPGAYARSQPPPIVPQPAYDTAIGTSTPRPTLVPARATSVTFTPAGATAPVTLPLAVKSVGQVFEARHGRAVGRLGVGHPVAGPLAPATLPLGPADPATEVLHATDPAVAVGAPGDGTQLWRIVGDAPRTHPVHIEGCDVQLVNRVGWDGTVRAPDPGELGWKDTVRGQPPGGRRGGAASRPTSPAVQDRRQRTAARPDPPGRRTAGRRSGQPGRRPPRGRGQPGGQPRLGVPLADPLGRTPRPGHEPAAGGARGTQGADRAHRHPGTRQRHRTPRHRADLDRQRQPARTHQPPAATRHRQHLHHRTDRDHGGRHRHPVHRRHSHARRHLPLPDPCRERGELLVLVQRRTGGGAPVRADPGDSGAAADRAAAGGAALGQPLLRHRRGRAAGHEPDVHQRSGHHGHRRGRVPRGPGRRAGHHVLLPGTHDVPGRRLALVDCGHRDHTGPAGRAHRRERHRERVRAGHRQRDGDLVGADAGRTGRRFRRAARHRHRLHP